MGHFNCRQGVSVIVVAHAPACPLEPVGQAVGLADREGDLSQAGRSFDAAGGAVALLAAQVKRELFPTPRKIRQRGSA